MLRLATFFVLLVGCGQSIPDPVPYLDDDDASSDDDDATSDDDDSAANGDDDDASDDDDATSDGDDDDATSDDDDATSDDDDATSDDDDATEDDDDATEDDDDATEDDCIELSRAVYVVGRTDNELYSFAPGDGSLTLVGELDCDSLGLGNPASMAVTRDGVGYVRWSDNWLYEVDLTTADCSATSYTGGGFGSFGMGYSTDSASTTLDTMYVANSTTLGVFDEATWTISSIGALPSQSELTGNSLGQLWAFLPLEQPALLAELDHGNASMLQQINLPSFPNPLDIDTFAFAWWGGSLWLYVSEYGFGRSTDVYEVDPNTGSMTLRWPDLGIDVVGAGVSTCAPVTQEP